MRTEERSGPLVICWTVASSEPSLAEAVFSHRRTSDDKNLSSPSSFHLSLRQFTIRVRERVSERRKRRSDVIAGGKKERFREALIFLARGAIWTPIGEGRKEGGREKYSTPCV